MSRIAQFKIAIVSGLGLATPSVRCSRKPSCSTRSSHPTSVAGRSPPRRTQAGQLVPGIQVCSRARPHSQCDGIKALHDGRLRLNSRSARSNKSKRTQRRLVSLHFRLLEAGYVGTRGTHLMRQRSLNQALNASASNPIRGETSNTIANIGERVPIPGVPPDSLLIIGI